MATGIHDPICTCKHHVSVHAYDPADQGREGPKKCGVPACDCKVFIGKVRVQLAEAERRWEQYLKNQRDAIEDQRHG